MTASPSEKVPDILENEAALTVLPVDEGGSDDSTPTEVNRLVELNTALHAQVVESLAAKRAEVFATPLPHSDAYFATRLHSSLNTVIAGAGYNPELTSIDVPSQKNSKTKGYDLAFNVSAMTQDHNRNHPDGPDRPCLPDGGAIVETPAEVAKTLKTMLEASGHIAAADTAGAFVNLGLEHRLMAPVVLAEVTKYGEHYGHFRDGVPETVIVDFSSPNVAKNMTLAHLRSTIIGDALCRIHTAAGDVTFGINHIGDWGTQFGNITYQYQRELAERGDDFLDELNENPTATLMRLYRTFTAEKETNPEMGKAGESLFYQLEQGEPQLVELWAKFREWSLRDFGPAYERLGVHFDAIQGESFYEDRMAKVIAEALEQGVLTRNKEGAVVFPSQVVYDPATGKPNERLMLDSDGNPRDEIIVKPSGGTVYLTRDLAAIRYRSQELGANRILYVIGKEQGPHCMMLFNMAAQMGYVALGDVRHVSFGHLNVDGRKMKSRAGKVVLLGGVLDEATEAATDMLKEHKAKRLGVSSEDITLDAAELQTARMVGTGSLIFNDLRQDRAKDIGLNPNSIIDLQAGATYIQYTNARLNSVLERAGEIGELTTIPEELSSEEAQLVAQIANLPAVIREAAEANAPHKIATYLTTLCQQTTAFYGTQRILDAPDVERTFRLHLTKAASQVIRNAAHLLNLELPHKM